MDGTLRNAEHIAQADKALGDYFDPSGRRAWFFGGYKVGWLDWTKLLDYYTEDNLVNQHTF